MDWLPGIIALIGGGVGVEIVRFMALRQNDGAKMRAELWAEIGALRARLDAQEKKIYRMQRRQHAVRKLVGVLKQRLLSLMGEVNQLESEGGREPRYVLAEEERNLLSVYSEGFNALDDDASDLETEDPEESSPEKGK